MRRKPQWLALLLVLGLIVAACGDGGGGDTTTTAAAEEEPTTTAAPVEETTTSAAEEGAGEVATDVGVDLEAGTITVGLLSDLSGPFAPLVQVIVVRSRDVLGRCERERRDRRSAGPARDPRHRI